MSLISVRNFLAPFTSPTNLVTLLVVTALFGVYRLSGGGIKVGNPNDRMHRSPKMGAVDDYLPLDENMMRLRNQAAPRSAANARRENVNPQALAPVAAAQKDQTHPDAFEDIFRANQSQSSSSASKAAKAPKVSLDEISKELGIK